MTNRMLALCLAVLCTACSAPTTPSTADAEPAHAPPPVKMYSFPIFGDMAVKGFAPFAKLKGYTDCRVELDTRLICAKPNGATVLGVNAKSATVVLTGKNVFEPDDYAPEPKIDGLPLDKLTYGDLQYEFAKASYDVKCLRRVTGNPSVNSITDVSYDADEVPAVDECAQPDTLAAFRAALRKEGWVRTSWHKRTERFYRRNVPLHVSFYEDFDNTIRVTVEPATLEGVAESFAAYDDQVARKKHPPGEDLINQMKSTD